MEENEEKAMRKAMSLDEYVRRMNEHHRFCLELFSKSPEELKKDLHPAWLELLEPKATDNSNPE